MSSPLFTNPLSNLAFLHSLQREQEQKGHGVTGICTAFPTHPPPPGMAYSKNFAACQQSGRFAVQVRD